MKRVFSLITVVAIFMLPLCDLSAQSGAGGRYALVIGEGAYQYVRPALTNPLNDADDMKTVLESLGFTVDLLQNASLRDMNAAVSRLKDRLSASADAFGFFFFAGHGMQADGRNYLLPVEAQVASVRDLQTRALDAQNVYEELRTAGNTLNVVVLDACRNSPQTRGIALTEDSSPIASGLAPVVYQPAGSIIVYATSPGETANDGAGRNGLFTEKLLSNLKNTNLEVNDVFIRTADDVQTESRDSQIPAIFSQFFKHAYFLKGKTYSSSLANSTVKDASKIIVTGIEVIQTQDGSTLNTENIVVNQFKTLAARQFNLSAVNFTLPSQYTNNTFLDEAAIIDYINKNSETFPARFVAICYAETTLEQGIAKNVKPIVTAAAHFTIFDFLTGKTISSDTVDTRGHPFVSENIQDKSVIAVSRRALQFLYDANNKPGLAGIMKEVFGKL
jgi:hypothetical protein